MHFPAIFAAGHWDKKFWLGGTPQLKVNIDNNLADLASTRFIPNFDTSIVVTPAIVATEYANYWTNVPHDIYDGIWDSGQSQNYMLNAKQQVMIDPLDQLPLRAECLAHSMSLGNPLTSATGFFTFACMRVVDTIRRKLTIRFAPVRLEIIDESHRHAGHAGARPEGETHFAVTIVSAAFAGQGRVARQRLVYQTLADELATRVHALSLTTLTPEEDRR
jgi:BolA protein